MVEDIKGGCGCVKDFNHVKRMFSPPPPNEESPHLLLISGNDEVLMRSVRWGVHQ